MLYDSKKVLFKDKESVNQRSKYNESAKELRILLTKALEENNLEKYFLDESMITNKKISPEHNGCGMNGYKPDIVNEKRICRCMFYYDEENDKCHQCLLGQKFKNRSTRYKLVECEYPMDVEVETCGGIDLVIEDNKTGYKYAVEVKPSYNNETLVRMIAEIFTYTSRTDEYKRAIAFFEGSRQEVDYIKYKDDDDFKYLFNYVSVFRIITSKNSNNNIIEYDFEEL